MLGTQIIGYEGVDKRIDVLATAIHAGLNATQLKDLDLAYAPPYSSAKDPVNMAGFMIDNIAKGTLKQWHLEDMDKISKDKDVVLIDVRTVCEFSRGHIDGFKNIPVDELRERISEIEKGKPVYLICQSGLRSYIASRILEGNGYETYNFSGGFRLYDAVVNDRALIEYYIGIKMIDEQHKQLFKYADEAYELLNDEFTPDKYDRVDILLEKLYDYTVKHLADEEAYMESIHYNKLFTQKVQHQAFIEKLDEFMESHNKEEENQDEQIMKILTYLTEWLVNHILYVDGQIPQE